MSVRLPPRLALALTDDDCAVLNLTAEAIRRHWRANGGGVPPMLDELLTKVKVVADQRVPLSPASEVASEVRSDSTRTLSEGAPSTGGWFTTRQAAAELGVDPRSVINAINARQLVAERVGRGRGVWRVDPTSVQRLKAARSEGAAA